MSEIWMIICVITKLQGSIITLLHYLSYYLLTKKMDSNAPSLLVLIMTMMIMIMMMMILKAASNRQKIGYVIVVVMGIMELGTFLCASKLFFFSTFSNSSEWPLNLCLQKKYHTFAPIKKPSIAMSTSTVKIDPPLTTIWRQV